MLTFGLWVGCGDGGGDVAKQGGMATPTPSATPAQRTCPARVELHVDGAGTELDLGSTGIAHDVPFHEGIVLPLTAACDPTTVDCARCILTPAPILQDERPRRRCASDVRATCSVDADCTSGPCIDLLGPPFGVTTGGVASCTRNWLVAVGPGTFDPSSGATVLPLALRWTFFAALDVGMPCPRCSGPALGAAGICEGGPHDGASCVVDGTDPLFGNTSYDCSPPSGAEMGSFELVMALTTGTSTLEPLHACTAFGGRACYCAEQLIANACDDGVCSAAGPDTDWLCLAGPMDGLCAREPFRGCRTDTDCPMTGDRCAFQPRECLGDANLSTGASAPLRRTGTAHPERPSLVATFCVPAASNSGPNQGLGLPGPATLRLPVRVRTGG
jgi:hypothetical protein